MKLLFWEPGIGTNFGENINTTMWKKIFPEHFFTTKDNIGLAVLCSGIFGSLLKKELHNVIFGSGGGYNNANADNILKMTNIKWMFVRGHLHLVWWVVNI